MIILCVTCQLFNVIQYKLRILYYIKLYNYIDDKRI